VLYARKLCQFTQNFTDVSHKIQYLKVLKSLSQLLPVPGAWCGILKVRSLHEADKVTKSTQCLMYRRSELSAQKIKNYVRVAYLSRSAADEGLYFWCSVRRRWCCCGRAGCTSSLLITVFCCRCPPTGQHSASPQHFPTHARAPRRVTIATGDEGPTILPNQGCSRKHRLLSLFFFTEHRKMSFNYRDL
jgi:hypothetical protein